MYVNVFRYISVYIKNNRQQIRISDDLQGMDVRRYALSYILIKYYYLSCIAPIKSLPCTCDIIKLCSYYLKCGNYLEILEENYTMPGRTATWYCHLHFGLLFWKPMIKGPVNPF